MSSTLDWANLFEEEALPIQAIENQLRAAGIAVIARVRESKNAFDFALATPRGHSTVIRYSFEPREADIRALRSMLAEGPFTRAILLYCEKEGSVLSDEIETWWIGDLDHLVARLAAEVGS